MRFLLDTGSALRLVVADDERHGRVRSRLDDLVTQGFVPVIVPQIVREFWSVATRPRDVNGPGLTPDDALRLLAILFKAADVLPDDPAMLGRWLDLVRTRSVLGRQVHDANIVAAMLVHGVTYILTLNPADFARYPELTVLSA